MDQQLKDEWVAALLGGGYKQGNGQLRQRWINELRHCCLGVLCELAAQRGLGKWGNPNDLGYEHEYYFVGHSETMPPDALMEEIGLNLVFANELAKKNDDGATFAEIAAIIKEEA